MYFPKLFFPELEETAQAKYQNYLKTDQAQEDEDDNSIASVLRTDTIGEARTIEPLQPPGKFLVKGLPWRCKCYPNG